MRLALVLILALTSLGVAPDRSAYAQPREREGSRSAELRSLRGANLQVHDVGDLIDRGFDEYRIEIEGRLYRPWPEVCPKSFLTAPTSDSITGCLYVRAPVKIPIGEECGKPTRTVTIEAGSRFVVLTPRLHKDKKNYCLSLRDDAYENQVLYFKDSKTNVVSLPFSLEECNLQYLPLPSAWIAAAGTALPDPSDRKAVERIDEPSPTFDNCTPILGPIEPRATPEAVEVARAERPEPPPVPERRDETPGDGLPLVLREFGGKPLKTCDRRNAEAVVCARGPRGSVSRYCDLHGAALAKIGYHIQPHKNPNHLKIPIFEKSEAGYFDTSEQPNAYLKTETPFFRAESLTMLRGHALAGAADKAKERRDWHLIQVAVPKDVKAEDSLTEAAYKLRVVASRRGLARADFAAIDKAMSRGPLRVKFDIVWDEIGPKGELQPPRTLASLAELAKLADPEKLDIGATGFETVASDIKARISPASQTFDRMIIVKELWDAPLPAVATLVEFFKAKKASTPGLPIKWLTVFSERAPAYGNAYLQAAFNKEFMGEFVEELDGASPNRPLINAAEFAKQAADEARAKAARQAKPGAKSSDEIITAAETVAETTGHIASRATLAEMLTALRDLRAEYTDEKRRSQRMTIAQLLDKSIDGFKTPKHLKSFYYDDIRYQAAAKFDEYLSYVQKELKSVAAEVDKPVFSGCTHVFIADRDIFQIDEPDAPPAEEPSAGVSPGPGPRREPGERGGG
ncbi:MAG: hypothetical protein NW215_01500 [Hyphomicrobiales bacterium]|nr:hypothetical protein [Hyphomicrobiales bacterium]